MSVDHLYFAWSVSPEGNPWVTHKCLGGEVVTYRVPPPWRISGDHIEPSFHCARCDRHVILFAADFVPWESIDTAVACTSEPEEGS